MISTQGLAKLAAVLTTVLALIAGPWALLGGIPMIFGNGWKLDAEVASWILVLIMFVISVGFTTSVLCNKRKSWIWLVPFFFVVVFSPPSAAVLFLFPLICGVFSAVLTALPLQWAE